MVKILQEIKAASVDEVLVEIKKAMDLANEDTRLPIKTVEIVLKVNAAASVGVGVTLPIISLFTGKIAGKVNHITETHIVFEPKPPGVEKKVTREKISESVRLIKDAIIKAQGITPDLQFKSATAQIDFTISEEGSINFLFIGSEEVSGTHSIIITFGEKEKPK